MATYYGSDTACLSDLPLISTTITDPVQLIGQRVARRLTTPRGALALINDDPNFGFDVRQYINAKLTPNQIATAQDNIQNEITKDEQVESAVVTFSIGAAGAISIGIALQSSAGPFSLTLDVTQLTTQLIFEFGT